MGITFFAVGELSGASDRSLHPILILGSALRGIVEDDINDVGTNK